MKLLCHWLIFFVLIPFPYFVNASGTVSGPQGLGNAYTAREDYMSVFHNPSGLAGIKSFGATAYYQNRFIMKETGFKGAAVVLPTKHFVPFLSYSSFGYSLYNKSLISLGLSKAFSPGLASSFQLDYHTVKFGDVYGKKGVLTGSAGFLITFSKQLKLAAFVQNPFRRSFSIELNERVPSIFELGIAYSLSEKVIISSDVVKVMNQKVSLETGIAYRFSEQFGFRGGFSTNSFQQHFGMYYAVGNIQIDAAASVHPVLGVSPGITFTYGKNQ